MTTKGKYTALEAMAIDSLINLVTDDVSEVRLNSIKVRNHKINDCRLSNNIWVNILKVNFLALVK